MRRFSSLLVSISIALSLMSVAVPTASAAGGSVTVKSSGLTAPATVPNTQIIRIARLNKTNSFLVAGIDSSTAGANLHIWKIKDDLTLDTTFAPVDLGDDFEFPTASNSMCMSSPMGGCYRLENMSTNETANTFALSFYRQLSVGSGMNSRSTEILSIALGNLANGTIIAKSNFIKNELSGYDPSTDFAAYNPQLVSKDLCTSTFGATYQNQTLTRGSLESFNMVIRPDSSVSMNLACEYGSSTMTTLTDYNTYGLIAFKPSGNSLVIDTSWGTNGVLKTFDDPTQCASVFNSVTDTSITSVTSPKIFTIVNIQKFPRQTTPPSGSTYTSYDGCMRFSQTQDTGSDLVSLKADGTVFATNSLSSNSSLGRWIIDPNGRWNNLVTTGTTQNRSTSFLRISTDGKLDSTFGTNGTQPMSNLPSTVSVDGTTVNMRYFFVGYATTATNTLFSGFSSGNSLNTFNCVGASTTYEEVIYPYYLSVQDGLLTTYGTNGLGEGVKIQRSTEDACRGTSAGVTYVNSKGQHALLTAVRAIGSQSAGFKYAVWDAAEGVTGGGDGAGALGVSGRTDTKVYSRKLPTQVQTNTTLNVLTKKASRTQSLRSRTPKICVTMTQSVVMVKRGTCTIQVVDKATGNTVRTLSTKVRSAEVEVGTTVNAEDPILFSRASTRLSAAAKAQIAELAASASSAKRIILVGHTALLTEATTSNNFISLQRSARVKAALQAEFKKAGVTVPISIVSLGSKAPVTTKKTESAQTQNRRVNVYIVP